MSQSSKVVCCLMVGAFLSFSTTAYERDTLCVGGRPAPRSKHVTYGHLPTRPGMIRDHIVPLCAGGTAVPENIQYQGVEEAHEKDLLEIRMCRAMCEGRVTPAEAREFFSGGTWKQIYDLSKLLP
jgi:hypothetical protein